MVRTLFASAALALSVAGGAQAATIQNGSFENSTLSSVSGFTTLGAGSTALTGWTIEGSIDYIGGYWAAHDGNRSVDLSGNGPGSIWQQINDLVIGTTYKVTYALAGNPDNGGGDRAIQVLLDGVGVSTKVFDTIAAGATRADMKWSVQSFTFTADAESAVLRFSSLGNDAYGPALDAVSISPVPLPAAAPLLLAGLGGLAWVGRRRRRAA